MRRRTLRHRCKFIVSENSIDNKTASYHFSVFGCMGAIRFRLAKACGESFSRNQTGELHCVRTNRSTKLLIDFKLS
jgi:hypothetical protein